MFWNKNNKHKKLIFDSGNTADNAFGLFYDNQDNCSKCDPDLCCLLLEGFGLSEPILLEGPDSGCVELEGCNG